MEMKIFINHFFNSWQLCAAKTLQPSAIICCPDFIQ